MVSGLAATRSCGTQRGTLCGSSIASSIEFIFFATFATFAVTQASVLRAAHSSLEQQA